MQTSSSEDLSTLAPFDVDSESEEEEDEEEVSERK